jgi:ATP-dependent Clp protease ATP-binding subunit ClpB
VRRRPYSVLLFDEVEKAHPDVWNVLLQVLDDGRLTDGQGRTVDFKNTVIILTSNLGSEQVAKLSARTDLSEEDRRALAERAVTEEVKKAFRPEFINRLDELVVFDTLGRGNIRDIVEIQLRRFQERLQKRGLSLELTTAAKDFLAEVGWDPQYGARPLKRALRKHVEDALAKRVLAGEFLPGTTVRVDVGAAGELSFTGGDAVKAASLN